MRAALEKIIDDVCADYDDNMSQLNQRILDANARDEALRQREYALEARCQQRAEAFEDRERLVAAREANVAAIQGIAAARLARIKILEERIVKLEAARTEQGERRKAAEERADKLQSAFLALGSANEKLLTV